MKWQGKWYISFFSFCWHPFQWLFPKRMEKELGDGREGPWWHRLSNTFQLLSLNKSVIGWSHRAAPGSQPGPLWPLTCFVAASKPHSWSWHPVPAPWTNRGSVRGPASSGVPEAQASREGICPEATQLEANLFQILRESRQTDLQWCYLSTTTLCHVKEQSSAGLPWISPNPEDLSKEVSVTVLLSETVAAYMGTSWFHIPRADLCCWSACSGSLTQMSWRVVVSDLDWHI